MLVNRVACSSALRTILQGCSNNALQARLFHTTLQQRMIAGSGHHPDIWDKRMLVWMKRYPNVEAVPNVVPSATMDKTRNQVRIRANLFLCVMCGVVSLIVYEYGKKKTKAGENFYTKHETAKHYTSTPSS